VATGTSFVELNRIAFFLEMFPFLDLAALRTFSDLQQQRHCIAKGSESSFSFMLGIVSIDNGTMRSDWHDMYILCARVTEVVCAKLDGLVDALPGS